MNRRKSARATGRVPSAMGPEGRSSIFQLVLNDLAIGFRVIGHGGFQIRLGPLAVGDMPVPLGVLIGPGFLPTSGNIFARPQLHIRGVFVVCADVNGVFTRRCPVGNAAPQVARVNGFVFRQV